MEEKSLFISSCTRREMARRRGNRGLLRTQGGSLPLQMMVAALVLAVALGAFVALRGGV